MPSVGNRVAWISQLLTAQRPQCTCVHKRICHGEEMVEQSDFAEIIASLRAMGLVMAAEVPTLTPLAGGVSADIVVAQTTLGLVCVKRTLPELKVAQEWCAPQSRGNAEKNWIRRVATYLPAAVPEIIGEDPEHFTFAMRYLDPATFKNWKTMLRDGEADPVVAARIAGLLGKIHDWTAYDSVVADEFANDENFEALRLDPYLETAARAQPDVADILQGLIKRTATTKEALVHGDFSPKNILIGPGGPVILDAECACYGDPAFDVAFCLNHLFLKSAWMPVHAARYQLCAAAFWYSYKAELRKLDPVALEARVVTLLPGLMLARVDGKSPVEYLSDPAVIGRVRAFAKHKLMRPERTVPGLIDAWSKEFIN